MRRGTGKLPALLLSAAVATAACGGGAHQAGGSAPVRQHRTDTSPASPVPRQSCGSGSPGAAGSGSSGPQPALLNAVQFVSASDGWVAGSDRILHTTDAGRHWSIQFMTSQAAQLASVDFTDAQHGWVTGASEILATTDGGAHWRALPEPCPVIRTVHFVSPLDGFAVAGGNLTYQGVAYPPMAGGVLLSTTDGGATWRRLAGPAGVQTVCFSDTRRGWLGASGNIYGTVNGGRSWALAVQGRAGTDTVAEVECAGPRAGWAEVIGPGAALGHRPHIGYHTSGRAWQPIFAEQYTTGPGLRKRVRAESPGSYPGPFSAISRTEAVFIGWCPACSAPASPRLLGPAPLDIALRGGAVLLRRGRIAGLSQATATAFVTASDGWVVGLGQSRRTTSLIMHTADGGRTWQSQYALQP
jgi:photosystem II stability/assembly factor-like uncharacterized protein